MQPRWSSIWLLLIRVPLWQRNFPLLRQFALFIELQRANRHPDTLRGSFCSGWRCEGTTVLGGQKVWMVMLQEEQNLWNGSGERLETPRWTESQSFFRPVTSLFRRYKYLRETNFWSRLCFWPFCQMKNGGWHAAKIPFQYWNGTLQLHHAPLTTTSSPQHAPRQSNVKELCERPLKRPEVPIIQSEKVK